MLQMLQKIKKIVMNPELRLIINSDKDVHFFIILEWLSIGMQAVGYFADILSVLLAGCVGFWCAFIMRVRTILRIYDEYEKEKKEKSSSNQTEESKED